MLKTYKSRKEINSDYRKRQKERHKTIEEELIQLRQNVLRLETQNELLKNQIKILEERLQNNNNIWFQYRNVLMINNSIDKQFANCSEKLERFLKESNIKQFDYSKFGDLRDIGKGRSANVYSTIFKGKMYALKELNNLHMDEKTILQYVSE
ncbi:12036_t:CDS:2 [Gigaspora margarita]|uniref:12036_t:CDS:1 n=1 Tax=Gigaspora margarita TaxID=4874 RepID=A0ABN7V153_GIGMA|nr:12036_t:CDS:2 [Gigaspora margarita]